MIVTDGFVLLNYPRTGSTFVRHVLRRLYGQSGGGRWRAVQGALGWGRPRFREFQHVIERTLTARQQRRRSQHGALCQVPARHRHKPCVSVTRHPLDRVVSLYEHGFWRTHPPAERRTIQERLPSFPDLDFGQFLTLLEEFDLPNVLMGQPLRADVGSQSVHFVRFYARSPDAALARLTDEAIDGGAFQEEFGGIRFLHLERLADELTAFLLEQGFREAELAFLREQQPLNQATTRRGRSWREYLDDDQIRRLRHKERMLFQLFPEYDLVP